MIGPLGWSYPAGAENDPNAPWNLPDLDECSICGEFIDDEDGCGCDSCEGCGKQIPKHCEGLCDRCLKVVDND